MNRKALVIAVFAASTLCVPVVAQPSGKGGKKGDTTVGDKVRDVLPASQRVFTVEEVTTVRNYFRDNRSGLPPGLAKRETLPPGLQMHLDKNGTLPPGLQKKIHPLPRDLERRLRVLPTGYKRVVIAGNVILMNEKTSRIYDLVRDVIP